MFWILLFNDAGTRAVVTFWAGVWHDSHLTTCISAFVHEIWNGLQYFLFLMPLAMVNLENPGKSLNMYKVLLFFKVQRPDDASSSTSNGQMYKLLLS